LAADVVIDWRLYRLAFLPALVAVIVTLFSLEAVPDPLEAPISLASFDEDGAAQTARQIFEEAPERTPGSDGDAAIADRVAQRFGEIPSAQVSEQSFSTSFEGEDVDARNVIATLPGDSDRRIVLLAPRDSLEGPGVASSAAATGVLLELADSFGGASHDKTIVFVSTAGAADGAIGAREFGENYPDRDLIDAAVTISQPGAAQPKPPFVVPWSAGPQSTAIQLTRTAAATVSAEVGEPAGLEASFGELLRLALPTALGEQAPLIERGIDAVTVSAAGERPLAPEDDATESLSEETLAMFGQATQTIVLALDAHPDAPEHGPSAYVAAAGNLVPGWAIGMIALTLLIPAGAAAVDGFARALRRDITTPLDLGWVIGRSLPFLGALALLYLLALVGLMPSPRFPFDPGRFETGWRAAVVFLLLAAAIGGAWYAARPLSSPRRASSDGLAVTTGVVLCALALGVWLLNPFLALLAVPAAHAWLAATPVEPRVRLAASAVAVALAALPAVVAFGWLADRLEVGVAVPWHLLLMVAGGQLGPGTALLGCLIAGALVAIVAAARAPIRAKPEPQITVRAPGRGRDEVSGRRSSGRDGVDVDRSVPDGDTRRISEGRRLTFRHQQAD
jgi:Peptidase family M28